MSSTQSKPVCETCRCVFDTLASIGVPQLDLGAPNAPSSITGASSSISSTRSNSNTRTSSPKKKKRRHLIEFPDQFPNAYAKDDPHSPAASDDTEYAVDHVSDVKVCLERGTAYYHVHWNTGEITWEVS